MIAAGVSLCQPLLIVASLFFCFYSRGPPPPHLLKILGLDALYLGQHASHSRKYPLLCCDHQFSEGHNIT